MVEEARALGILDVARRLGLQPAKRGREYMARCPFHEDRTPSFSIAADKGVWHCFGCGRGGDALGLWMQVRRVDFATAVRELTHVPVGPP
jgi:DNA primase